MIVASLNPLPGVKAGTVVAGMVIFCLVLGLSPSLSFLSLDSNEPNPTSTTLSPLATVSTMVSSVAFNTLSACFWVHCDLVAIACINSALFIGEYGDKGL